MGLCLSKQQRETRAALAELREECDRIEREQRQRDRGACMVVHTRARYPPTPSSEAAATTRTR